MQPFVLNKHGRLVFPSNFIPELDFSVVESEAQLDSVIRRDFEQKAPRGTEIKERVEAGKYTSRFELMRDVALNLFWVNRFAVTMYVKQPMRWRDVPRNRQDIFLPIVEPWIDSDAKVAAVRDAYDAMPATWDAASEDGIWQELFEVYSHRTYDATRLPSIKPTIAEALAEPGQLTFVLDDYDPDRPMHSYDDILDVRDDVPELEALRRWSMVLHNQYPWDHAKVRLAAVGDITDDDVVVLFLPRSRDVLRFIEKVKGGNASRRSDGPHPQPRIEAVPPVAPYPAVDVLQRFQTKPKIEALAAVKGEHVCTNDDLIRNAAYSWSPMSAAEISSKTGIEQRRYTSRDLEEISLEAAQAALAKAGRKPEEIGAVLFCSCTSHRMMPSMATWLSGQLGMYQTHASVDLVAACAGLPYGLTEAARILQEVNRPVLLVCGEKFSDKIGTVRPSRMIFGDGAAAIVIGPAGDGEDSDITLLQTYASGPVSQVNSIIWPNPAFDNNITVYGPEVKTLAGRYLTQMIEELQQAPDPHGGSGSAWDTVELVVPHQANKTMVIGLAQNAGLGPERLYFNIETMGNTSSASIPIAIADAVADKVIDRPMWIFAPGFGAGAVAGYSVMRIDPEVVVPIHEPAAEEEATGEAVVEAPGAEDVPHGSSDISIAFGS
ncbi:MAG TPA: 3-oxoacyl-[acyl-carrier-protein] synthase III C-terminal domain-containing protein [Dermatophilaceae bacterium]|nr:3-oxoacyl-[acyl-carrier-protein] synthase III C-terminal domain-containing protein [Dermatophilaceae bacterium]